MALVTQPLISSPTISEPAKACWHVLGVGSLGSLWATRLAQAGHEVRLILRDAERLSAYQAAGGYLRLQQPQQQSYTDYALAAETPDTITSIQRLVVACKAYDVVSTLKPLLSRLQGAEVLLLQNGLGSQQAVMEFLPHTRCLLVSSTEGAYRQQPFQVVHAGVGQNWLGDPLRPQQPPEWLKDLAQANIPHVWAENIMGRLWRKLAINCAINPLTVLLRCRNGVLLEHQSQWEPICLELQQLLSSAGHPESAHDLIPEVQQILQATQANYSSMYQDVKQARPTEITYLLGYACTEAQRLGLELPHLQRLHQQLQQELSALGLPSH